MRLKRILVAACFLLLAVSPVFAEGLLDKNLHYFQPVVDGSGLLTSYGSEPLGMFRMYYGFMFDDSLNILDYENFEGDEAVLISNQPALNFVWGIGFWRYVNVGVGIGYVPTRTMDQDYLDNNEYPPAEREGVDVSKVEGPRLFDDDMLAADEDTKANGLEDIRIDVKLIGFDRLARCLGVGLVTTFATPINYKPNQYLSDGGLSIAPRLVVDLGRTWWTFVFNGGYKYFAEKSRIKLPPYSEEIDHPNTGDMYTEDELIFGGGMKFRFSFGDEFLFDTNSRTQAGNPFGDNRIDYVEVMGAYRKTFRGMNFTAVTMGGGVGLLDGMGNPMARFFLGIGRDEKRIHMLYN
jgi:hypothetical protein